MMQSAQRLSLILMGLRCGCCIILWQVLDLQPALHRKRRVSE